MIPFSLIACSPPPKPVRRKHGTERRVHPLLSGNKSLNAAPVRGGGERALIYRIKNFCIFWPILECESNDGLQVSLHLASVRWDHVDDAHGRAGIRVRSGHLPFDPVWSERPGPLPNQWLMLSRLGNIRF